MDIINLQIEQSYLKKAAEELNLPDFPSTDIISKLIDSMCGTLEPSQKMQSMINWIDLLEKKYRETITSIVYGPLPWRRSLRSYLMCLKVWELRNQGDHVRQCQFGKIQAQSKKIDLRALDTSLKTLNQERHAHTHGMTPEMTRHQISSVAEGSINGAGPIEVIMHGIDDSKLPVTPYLQLIRCKVVLDLAC
jgi:hypothetical protein